VHPVAIANASSIAAAGGQSGGKDKAQWMAVELMGMFTGKQGMLNGIKPGRHVLELRVVAEDHQTELDAQDRIEFVVK
jgi:hypothetical protein